MGLLLTDMGDFGEAEKYFLQSMEIDNSKVGEDLPEYASHLIGLGVLYSKMGNYKQAENYLLEAKKIRKMVFGENHTYYAFVLNHLAVLYNMIGEYDKAELLFLESKEIRSKVHGKNHPSYARTIHNLADTYRWKGDYSNAEAHYLESLKIKENTIGKNHKSYTTSLNNLGFLYEQMVDYKQAEELYKEAIRIDKIMLGDAHPDYISSINNLAMLYFKMGELEKAEPYYLQSIEKTKSNILKTFMALSEKEKKALIDLNQLYFKNFESYCLSRWETNPLLLADLYNLRLITKGLLFSSSSKMRQRILESDDQELIKLFNNWQSQKDYLVKVYQMTNEEKLSQEVDEIKLEEEANSVEKELNERSSLFGSINEKRDYSWKDIQQQLNKGEAAIEMIRTLQQRPGNKYYVVYAGLIITPETTKHPKIVILENGADLENKFIKSYRNAIKFKVDDKNSYQEFWQPLAENLKDYSTIYFSPDGVYNQLNLNTLLNPNSGKYLIQELDIIQVGNTKDIIGKKEKKDVEKSIISASLFGFPNFNSQGNTYSEADDNVEKKVDWKPDFEIDGNDETKERFFDGQTITELPGTKKELESIRSILNNSGIKVDYFQFDMATEENIKKLDNPQLLHLATHGFFLSDISKSRNEEGRFAAIGSQRLKEDPLLRSGLLFAGAKNAFDSEKRNKIVGEDGVLTAFEAMNLDLDKTDIVVLSACETGLGVSSNGEGVYGLQRAFQIAGAKSVLLSLWTVSDEATQEMMTLFYRNWVDGKKIHQAFHDAQMALMENYPHPYYWGAFVLTGN